LRAASESAVGTRGGIRRLALPFTAAAAEAARGGVRRAWRPSGILRLRISFAG